MIFKRKRSINKVCNLNLIITYFLPPVRYGVNEIIKGYFLPLLYLSSS